MDYYEEEEFVSKINVGVWKKVMSLVKKQKNYLFILSFLNSTIAIIDIIFPLMSLFVIRVFVEQKDISNAKIFMFVAFFVFLVQAVQIYFFIVYAGKLEVSIMQDIRKKGFEKVQSLSFSYFDTTPIGWIITRLTSDAHHIGEIIAWNFLDVIWSGLVISLAIIIMFIINAKLAFFILLLFPIIFLVSYYFQIKILNGHRENRRINSKITSYINENIAGIKTTKTLVREQRNFDEFYNLTNDMKISSVKVAKLSSLYIPLIIFISSFGFAIIINIGGNSIIKKTMDIAAFSAFINYLTQIFEHIRMLAKTIIELQRAQASAERTFSLLETESDIIDTPDVVKEFGDCFNPKKENWPIIKGKIEFKNVSFSYRTGEKILENFNFLVNKGEKIALVGETGSGKSTIVNLICRFYEPTNGQIFIDDNDYKTRSQLWLHSNIGYVLQTPHLFSGTIKENIIYGKLDASFEEIVESTKLVDAYDFIMSFEDGFDTQVGESGNRLSLGQKQLISFARAIIGNPSIFILDEATSSVDTETEQKIQTASFKVLEGRTSFIIAHRLSTIRFCDKIVVIKNGKILESGTHSELIKLKQNYYKLYTNQFVEEAEKKILGD